MLAMIITCVVLVTGLGFYAMHRSDPGRLKRLTFSAGVPRLFWFSIEVESDDDRPKELPPD